MRNKATKMAVKSTPLAQRKIQPSAKKTVAINQPKNFLGAGATSENSGVTPYEHHGMGYNYGLGMKNKMGRMRGDSIGYIPASPKQLGTPPRQVV